MHAEWSVYSPTSETLSSKAGSESERRAISYRTEKPEVREIYNIFVNL